MQNISSSIRPKRTLTCQLRRSVDARVSAQAHARRCAETGRATYQHPARTARDFPDNRV